MTRDRNDPNVGPEPGTLRFAEPLFRAGFVQLPRTVLLDARLSHGAVRLFAVLMHHAQGKGECWPGYDLLQMEVRCGRAQISGYLKELEDSNYLARLRRGQGQTSKYVLSVEGNANSSSSETELLKFRNGTTDGSVSELEVKQRSRTKEVERERPPVLPNLPLPPAPVALAVWRATFPQDTPSGAHLEALETLGATLNFDVDKWRRVCQAWALAGYRGPNLTGLLQWYRDDIPERARPVTPKPSSGAPASPPNDDPIATVAGCMDGCDPATGTRCPRHAAMFAEMRAKIGLIGRSMAS